MADDTKTRQDATVRDFLNVVFRRKYLILSIVGLTAAIVFYLNGRRPVLYVSGSRVMVKRGERADAFSPAVRYLGWGEEMSSELELILSEEVFERAREIFADSLAARGIQRPLQFRGGAVRADVVGESNVFAISYTGFDPVECQLGCNAATLSYRALYRERNKPPDVSEYLTRETAEVARELEDWRQRKNDFLNKQEYFGVDEDGRHAMARITQLDMQLSNTRADIVSQQARVSHVSTLLSLSAEELEDRLTFSASSSQVLQSGMIANIKYSLQNLRIRREELMNRYTERHPEVVAIDAQIHDLGADLKAEVENLYQQEYGVLREMLSKEKMLQEQLDAAKVTLSSIPDRQTELDRIDDKIRLLENKHDLLLRKQSDAEIALASMPQREITILSPASRATARKTRDYVRMALGPLLAFVVGLGLAFFLDSLDHSLKNAGEVEQYLNKTVLATISETRTTK